VGVPGALFSHANNVSYKADRGYKYIVCTTTLAVFQLTAWLTLFCKHVDIHLFSLARYWGQQLGETFCKVSGQHTTVPQLHIYLIPTLNYGSIMS